MVKSFKGAALARFVADRKEAIRRLPVDQFVLEGAIKALDALMTHNSTWDLDHDEFPSLPARPKFSIRPNGKAYTNIPVPRQQRQRYGACQIQKRWPQERLTAWAHYVAAIDEAVEAFTKSPEENEPEPENPGLEGIARFIREPGSLIDQAFTAVLESPVVTDMIASEQEVSRLKTDIKVSIKFLAGQGCTRLSHLGKPALMAFRRHCQRLVIGGEKSLRTVNGHMAALRRVLKWAREFLEVDVPLHTDSALMNIRPKDLGAEARTGGNHLLHISSRRSGRASLHESPGHHYGRDGILITSIPGGGAGQQL